MDTLHIVDFYNDCAKIMLALFRAFPRKISLYIEDVSGLDALDDFGMHSNRHMACFYAFIWLFEEAFIRYQDSDRQLAFHGCVLTRSTYMKLYNGAEHTSGTLISRLQKALNEGSSSQIQYLMHELLI